MWLQKCGDASEQLRSIAILGKKYSMCMMPWGAAG
jgi:hypothetical protein